MALKWGILGTGRITRKLAAAMQQATDAELVAIASRTQERANEAAREMAIPTAHGSYEALLADPNVQAVYNALPNTLHAEWTIRAAQAGKHVLCEKPISVTHAEAVSMFSAARAAKVFLMEAFMYRFHPQTLAVQELLRSGALGELKLVRASFGFLLDRPADIRWRAELQGGALMDVGCYCLSFARMAVGSLPLRVNALTRPSVSGVDALLAATLEFAGGEVAQINADFVSSFHQTADIAGSDGVLELERAFTMPPDHPSRIRLWRGTHFAMPELIEFAPVNQYQLQIEGFDKLVYQGHGAWPEMPMLETLENMATIEALFQSAREQRPVDVTRDA